MHLPTMARLLATVAASMATVALCAGCGSSKAPSTASSAASGSGASGVASSSSQTSSAGASGSSGGSSASGGSAGAASSTTATSGQTSKQGSSQSSSSSQGKSLGTHSGVTFTKGTAPNWATVPASTPAKSGVVQIAYREFTIDPDALKVKVGTTLKWTNYDQVAHNVTSEGSGPIKLASGEFGEGHSFEVKVTKPGVIHYESTNFPTTMNGTIVVVE